MRKLILIALVLGAHSLLAQQAPVVQDNSEEARPAQPQAQQQQALQPQAAPKLGHPLDPADVDVLTGKTKAGRAPGYAATPYPYVSYPVNVADYAPSRSLGWNSPASPPFVPLGFGRFNRGNFFVIGNTTSIGPPLFFFGRGRTGLNTFFFGPARPGFGFFRR